MANFTALSQLLFHDWILYAYARAHGHCWRIDSVQTMRYRPHQSNEVGMNFGLKAVQRRLALAKEGRYCHDIVIIPELTGASSGCARALRWLKWSDWFCFIGYAGQFRRSLPEVLAFRLIFVLMPATPIPAVA